MRLDQMFPDKNLRAQDLLDYNPAGTYATIAGVASQIFPGDNGEPEISHSIRFVEFKKPMRLNKSNATTLYERWSDSEDWVGKVVLIKGFETRIADQSSKGKMKTIWMFVVELAPEGARPVLPPNTDITAIKLEVEGGHRKAPPGSTLLALGPAAPPPPAAPLPKFGADAAEKMHAQIKLRGKTFDDMLRWLYLHENATYNMIYGNEAADFPGEAKPGIFNFLKAMVPPPPGMDSTTGEIPPPPPAPAVPPPAAPTTPAPAAASSASAPFAPSGRKSVTNLADENGIPAELSQPVKPLPPPPGEIDVPF